jgi:hypothetical protein
VRSASTPSSRSSITKTFAAGSQLSIAETTSLAGAMPGATSDLLEEIQIRRFGRGDGQDAAHQEQWEHPMLPHEVAGQDLHHRRIGDAGEIAGERNAAARGDRLRDVHLADQSTLDQDLAEQTMIVLLLLRPERRLQIRPRDPPAGDQRLTKRRSITPAGRRTGRGGGVGGGVDGHRAGSPRRFLQCSTRAAASTAA